MGKFLATLFVLSIAACHHTPPSPSGASGPIPDAGIGLSEGVCFGTCPEYSITVYPNDFYQLVSGRFTRNPGTSTGTLPAGAWTRARTALSNANFNSLPLSITPGETACGNQVATDLPQAMISETTIAGSHVIDYYPGCFSSPHKAALDDLLTELRTAFQIETLVNP